MRLFSLVFLVRCPLDLKGNKDCSLDRCVVGYVLNSNSCLPTIDFPRCKCGHQMSNSALALTLLGQCPNCNGGPARPKEWPKYCHSCCCCYRYILATALQQIHSSSLVQEESTTTKCQNVFSPKKREEIPSRFYVDIIFTTPKNKGYFSVKRCSL